MTLIAWIIKHRITILAAAALVFVAGLSIHLDNWFHHQKQLAGQLTALQGELKHEHEIEASLEKRNAEDNDRSAFEAEQKDILHAAKDAPVAPAVMPAYNRLRARQAAHHS